ncbi:protein FAR1-RELATED SEQUENCE 5-like [Bidens hawaiensis]|uniref:protein FAR1-RELATED SEQUENCE 5-like n=1 Tax=Bidens hawaiensis TaxID=980011 RepID=UPI00404A7D05
MSLNRIGPTVAHRLLVSIKGCDHNIRGTPIDFKNFYTGMRIFISDRDSQLVIDRLKDRYESCPEFFFGFTVENGKLRFIFWADEVSKLNYKAFGHVLAFDATYQTDRYKMIFVPFTGVDHHKKIVSFGAALISSETIDSYKWLLQSFLNCHGEQPKLVLSDHDPSMRQPIVQVYGDVIEYTNIRSRIHLLVWNLFITPDTFESRWHYLIEMFGLQDNEWLNDMFDIRDRWLPAYFRDILFGCLMKTTSRCESSNATFKVNSTSANTLVKFMLCMKSRLNSQRYSQRIFEYKTSSASFQGSIGEEIEKHAFDLYTQIVFKEVRKEIMKGKYCCYVTNTKSVVAHVLYSVTHLDKRKDITNVFLVKFDPANNFASCSGMGFTRNGLLCRLVFCVYRMKKVDKIPLKILEMVSQCVDILRVDSEGLNSFAMKIKELKSVVFQKSFKNVDAVDDNETVFEDTIGNVNEGDDFIENPVAVQIKGCGKLRRVVGETDKNVEKASKVARLCRTCGEYV